MKTILTKQTLRMGAAFLVGMGIGGYLFLDVRPRSFLDLPQCVNCLHPNEVVGLVAAVGIKKAPGLIPTVVHETDSTLVIKHPAPAAPYHVVLISKMDIKSLSDVGGSEREAVADVISLANSLIRREGLNTYRLWTNGPGTQIVAYLHFHLAGSN